MRWRREKEVEAEVEGEERMGMRRRERRGYREMEEGKREERSGGRGCIDKKLR